MKSAEQFVESFYEDNKSRLEESYPGIHKGRLLDFFCRTSGIQPREAMTLDELNPLFKDILSGKPLEYISNERFFYNSSFYVNESALIPRNETEILVELALKEIDRMKCGEFAEVGVGTGCVSLSILSEADRPLKAYATDICEEAIKVADVNYFRHRHKIHPKSSFDLYVGDRLVPLQENFSLIVSNPPYIDTERGMEGVHWQTRKFEPHKALFIGHEHYNEWFDKFFKQASESLDSGGVFLMEGHEDRWLALGELAKKHFSDYEILSDLTGAKRFLRAVKEQ